MNLYYYHDPNFPEQIKKMEKKKNRIYSIWLFFSAYPPFLEGKYLQLIVDERIIGPSWIWTSVDILPTNLQSVPINRSGIDPGRINSILGLLMIHDQLPYVVPYPQGKSNPRCLLEREMSWTTRRWGHTCPTAIILWTLYEQFFEIVNII